MHPIACALLTMVAVAALTGCQLVEALLPDGQELSPDEEGTCAAYQIVDATTGEATPDEIEQTRTIVENRINSTGVADAAVYAGEDGLLRIVVPVFGPGSDIAQEIRILVTTPGVLAFMPVPPELQGLVGEGPLPEGMRDQAPLLTGTDFDGATVGMDQEAGQTVVDLQLGETGAQLLDEWAAEHLGERFAIVLDDKVMAAPAITARRFGGRAQIAGGFTPSEAQRLVTVLRFGSLPLEVHEVRYGPCDGSGSR